MPIHVLIRRLRGQGDGRTIVLNRREEWVAERIVGPWERGEELVVNGEHWHPREIRVTVRETAEKVSGEDSLTVWANMGAAAVDRTDELLARAAGSAAEGDPVEFAEDRRKVMVVLGRNAGAGKALFEFLRTIDLRPLEWTQLVGAANRGAPYIGQVLDEAFAQAQAVVVLSTPDDIAFLRPELVPEDDPEDEAVPMGQARPNVFYEAGMAIGRFPTRTIFVEVGTMRSASDLSGIHAVRMDDGPECRRDLAQRLENAGCEVDTEGTDWLTAGEFQAQGAVETPAEELAPEDAERAALRRRIDAFVDDLRGDVYATEAMAQTFNELVEKAGVDGIPRAGPLGTIASMSRMRTSEMRMLMNQIKAQL